MAGIIIHCGVVFFVCAHKEELTTACWIKMFQRVDFMHFIGSL